jgi:hypothetical protein
MAKMRAFTFYDGEETKTVEALGYRRAVKSFQNDTKSKQVRVEWQAKKGGLYEKQQPLPLGRKIRQAALIEKKRAALKAKAGK